ncbi:SDR family oxidoreductase [Flavihumibacter sp. UBA7668]|uniref:SDR family oxidoreductase n=1 Tax=Flavihumibacter sp. UBA7668 TaxID=1946542 RepID=UPI0025C324D9|nr:SDR family oxidoreductase [Flavihumibacter sp. UBA7668]
MKILVTGGAGFIGSHIVENLLVREDIEKVRVLDNFSTGHRKNLEPFFENPKFSLIEGDIRSVEDCEKAVEGVDAVCHQAALGSVPRSIQDPITSHNVNVNGFLNILEAVRKFGVKKMVYASSSSVYGDLADSPKVEERTGKLLSPYAATKMANELYAEVYAKTYGIQLVGFRYFNVFGPRQDPNGPYAAVIPLFIKAALEGTSPKINGDGSITRDFTYISNVVKANLNAMLNLQNPNHKVFNVACGSSTSLNELWSIIAKITSTSVKPEYGPVRKGDILQSLAMINSIENSIDYSNLVPVEVGLKTTVHWYKTT